jgi:hypothetical protein
MQIFGLIPVDEKAKPKGTVVVPSGDPESLVPEWMSRGYKAVNQPISAEAIRTKLQGAIVEASNWLSTGVEGLAAGISVDSVAVELGVTIGGEIGLFAKGRTDIAASFTVTLKIKN